jgi:hypothetical protein
MVLSARAGHPARRSSATVATARQARLILEYGDLTVTIPGEIETVHLQRWMPGRVFHEYTFAGGIPQFTEPLTTEGSDGIATEDGETILT